MFINDIMFGLEYEFSRGLSLRTSTVYDSIQSGDLIYNFGTGLLLERVAGFGSSVYHMALDYNYTLYPSPRTDDPSHTVSVRFLGQSTDQRPIVLYPKHSYVTDVPSASFNGEADKNSIVYVYNNDVLLNKLVQIKMVNGIYWDCF